MSVTAEDHREALRHALHVTLVGLAQEQPEPLVYLEGAKTALVMALSAALAEAEDGPTQNFSRVEVASACDAVWPAVLAHFRH